MKWAHVALQRAWLVPFAWAGYRSLLSSQADREPWPLLILSVGGALNWVLQPMFNNWYAAPLTVALCIAGAIGLVRLLGTVEQRVVVVCVVGLYAALIPSTSVRWLKLIDGSGYRLVDHYSRQTVSLCKDNSTAAEQAWMRSEVRKLIDEDGRTGVLFNDATVLHGVDTRPGFRNFYWPALEPEHIAGEIESGKCDVIVTLDPTFPKPASEYQDRMSQADWAVPPEAENALRRRYEVWARDYGYVIYARRDIVDRS